MLLILIAHHKYRTMAKHTDIATVLVEQKTGEQIEVKGWVRAFRANRFIALNDGSGANNLQVVVDYENFDDAIIKDISFHACIAVKGQLIESQGKGQAVELVAESIEILGANELDKYPLQPKRQTMEYLREQAHFRMRTNTFSSIFRLRHALAFAVHSFFNENGFYYMHTPIITGSDAEGAGEMFQVTTLDVNNPARTEDNKIDYSQDFFAKATNLTVSGQLQAEIGAMAMGKVYTFGPTFRAENSNTSRHLAEFWMIEPEVAFADLKDNMDLAEAFVKYLINYVLDKYMDDLKILDAKIQDDEKNMKAELRRPMGLIETLRFVVEDDFARITYSEAINLLRSSKPYKKGKFEYDVEWGVDLQAEHERWLVEKKFKKPVIVTDYPKDIKAFYMRMNEDGKTVAAMDILFPGIGEVVGGSQREERLDVLKARMTEMDVEHAELDWYLDLRRFGGNKHAGFGLGFERIVLFITGMTNIRDVIAFPRTPGNAEF